MGFIGRVIGGLADQCRRVTALGCTINEPMPEYFDLITGFVPPTPFSTHEILDCGGGEG